MTRVPTYHKCESVGRACSFTKSSSRPRAHATLLAVRLCVVRKPECQRNDGLEAKAVGGRKKKQASFMLFGPGSIDKSGMPVEFSLPLRRNSMLAWVCDDTLTDHAGLLWSWTERRQRAQMDAVWLAKFGLCI